MRLAFLFGQMPEFFLLFECVIIVLVVTVNQQSITEILVRRFMKEKGFWEGVQAAMPTALGYVSIGLACGIIGSPYVAPVEMGLMSLFVYAGSA